MFSRLRRTTPLPYSLSIYMEEPQPQRDDVPTFIRALMPDASETELHECRDAVEDYLKAVLGILDRQRGTCGQCDSREMGNRSTILSRSQNV